MSSNYLFLVLSISTFAQCAAFLWGCSTCCSTCGGGSSIVGYGYVPPTTTYAKVPVYGIIRGRPQASPVRTQIIRQYIPVERPYVAPPRYQAPPPPPPPSYNVPPPPPPSEYEQGPVESGPPPQPDYSDAGSSVAESASYGGQSTSYGGQENLGDAPVAQPLSEASPFWRRMLSARRTV
uniref:Leucine-rich repeat extensin-like protein 3 n=1 Tax=Panagrellus redivivus TaxID=6233 RepID=A0A7E4VSR4_PANRE